MRQNSIFSVLLLLTPTVFGQAQPPSPSHTVSCDLVLGLTYIHARVNGSRPLTMVLDSGASYTVLQPEIAAELNIRTTGTQQTTGLGANAALHMVQNATLEFASETLREQTISVLPLTYIEQEAGHKTDGLLGGNLFMNFAVGEDYQHHTVTLVPPLEFTPPTGYRPIPVTVSGNSAFAQLTVGGADGRPVTGMFLIDSGNVANVILMKRFVDANPSLLSAKLVSIPSVTAVGGKLNIASGKLGLLKIGPYSMHDMPAAFLRAENSSTPGILAGVLGNGILRKFDVIFDYPHGKLWLRPNADFPAPFPVNASGLLLQVKPPDYSVVLVRDVLPGSPAQKVGVHAGDVLEEFRVGNGKPLKARSLAQISDAMSTTGEHVTLVLKRAGKTITVKLETRSLI